MKLLIVPKPNPKLQAEIDRLNEIRKSVRFK